MYEFEKDIRRLIRSGWDLLPSGLWHHKKLTTEGEGIQTEDAVKFQDTWDSSPLWTATFVVQGINVLTLVRAETECSARAYVKKCWPPAIVRDVKRCDE